MGRMKELAIEQQQAAQSDHAEYNEDDCKYNSQIEDAQIEEFIKTIESNIDGDYAVIHQEGLDDPDPGYQIVEHDDFCYESSVIIIDGTSDYPHDLESYLMIKGINNYTKLGEHDKTE